jgi:hypothetical protein
MSSIVTDIITTDRPVANNEKRLSICLRSNGFSFSVSTIDNELLTVGDIQSEPSLPANNLAQLVTQTVCGNEASLGYKQMNLIVPSMQFAWIPDHLYDPALNRQYLQTVTHISDSIGIYHAYSAPLNSHIVFSAPADIVTAFKVNLPGIDITCQHAILAQAMILSSNNTHPVILMHVRESATDIEALFNGRLLLSGSYPANNNEDALYHALSVMKHLHLETPDMELYICGLVDRDFYTRLQHFFPNVSLYTGKPYSFINPDFQTLHTYKHALILS